VTTDMVDTRKLQRAQARVGEVLRGKWRLDRLLGVGGMASVYAATHRNGKHGAVKMLHPEWVHDEDASARFLREGYATNTVDHPGVVSVLDDDVAEDGSVFLVMELLSGETTDARAKARPGHRLDVAEVVAIADLLLDVLAAAHDKGIVHRDIKPANVFLTPQGQLKVLDFGIARLRELTTSSPRTTQTGNAIGTPAFMAREQARGYWSKVDARTDLWAAGATMFTLLTGRQVHEAETVQTLMLAAMTKPAPRIGTVLPSVPTMLAAIIDRALAFEQKDRWPDARTMQRALRELPDSLAPDPAVLVTSEAMRTSTHSLSLSTSFAPGVSQHVVPGAFSLSQATVLPVSNDRERKGRGSGIIVAGVLAVLAIIGGATFVLLRYDTASPETDLQHPPLATAEIAPAAPAPPRVAAAVTPAPSAPPLVTAAVAPLAPAPSATADVADAAPPPLTASAHPASSAPVTRAKFGKLKVTPPPPPAPPPKAAPAPADPFDKF
jgi:eukaryotic-like serine/threonine-protein kinase